VKGEKLRARIGGGRRTYAPWDLNVSDATTNGPAFSGVDVNGGVQWDPSSALRMNLATNYLWHDANGIDAPGTGAIFDRRRRTELFDTTLRTNWAPRVGSDFAVSLRHSQFRDQLLQDQRASRQLDQYEDAREQISQGYLQFNQAFGSAHRASVGVEQSLHTYLAERLESGRGDRSRTGVFAQDEWLLLERWKLVLLPGLRADIDSQFGLHVSPRLATSARPTDGLTLRAAWGQGFRAPSFEELLIRFTNPSVGYEVEGNTTLRPERSNGFTLSADFTRLEWVHLGGSLFLTTLEDLITVGTLAEATAESPVRYGYLNVARARSQGAELTARFRLLQGIWLDTGYAVTDARDLDSGKLLEGRSIHRITGRLSGRVRPLGIEGTLSAVWNGPRRFDALDGSDVWTAPWTRLDINLKRRMWTHLSLFAGARNILDAGDADYLPIAPRQFYGGVEVDL
jgi:outer membrane receptor for ferrienterochelin and colicins